MRKTLKKKLRMKPIKKRRELLVEAFMVKLRKSMDAPQAASKATFLNLERGATLIRSGRNPKDGRKLPTNDDGEEYLP